MNKTGKADFVITGQWAKKAHAEAARYGQANVVGMVTVSIPISGWWSGNHEVKHQKIAEQIARQDRDDNRQLLIIQMQSAYNDLDNSYKQILVARKSIEQSTENLRLNEDYYMAGTATMSDLLDAQTSNQQSLDKYTETVCNAYAIIGRNMLGVSQ